MSRAVAREGWLTDTQNSGRCESLYAPSRRQSDNPETPPTNARTAPQEPKNAAKGPVELLYLSYLSALCNSVGFRSSTPHDTTSSFRSQK